MKEPFLSEAKSLHGKNIQHMTIWIDSKAHYLCNQAVQGTITKMVVNPADVTCKNCLKILKAEAKTE